MTKTFATQFAKNKSKPEVNNGPDLCEKAGYIPAQKQIENMIFAGERLALSRKEMFDAETDEDAEALDIDPTRSGSFDLADATAIGHELQRKSEVAKRAATRMQKMPDAESLSDVQTDRGSSKAEDALNPKG